MSKPLKVTNYRGSPKHKKRPSVGPKGTLCPEWTHHGLGTDVHTCKWVETDAATLFENSEIVEGFVSRRFATANGIAFEAKPSNDGTWHGFPIPWEQVPPEIKNKWLEESLVSGRQIKKYFSFDDCEISWALQTDDKQ